LGPDAYYPIPIPQCLGSYDLIGQVLKKTILPGFIVTRLPYIACNLDYCR